MKLRTILWVALFISGIQFLRSTIGMVIFIKFNEHQLIEKFVDIQQLTTNYYLVMIAVILSTGFLILTENNEKQTKSRQQTKKPTKENKGK